MFYMWSMGNFRRKKKKKKRSHDFVESQTISVLLLLFQILTVVGQIGDALLNFMLNESRAFQTVLEMRRGIFLTIIII